jgi:site-specific recombinase XerD
MTASDPITSALQSVYSDLAPGSRRVYELNWRRFTEWCATQQVDPLKVTPKVIKAHVSWLKEQKNKKEGPFSRSTISGALSSIREIYRALVNDEVIEVNPAREAKTPKIDGTPKTPWMTQPQMLALYKAMPSKTWREQRDRLIVRAMMSMGWRRAEIARMRADHIDGGAIHVKVKGGKSSLVGVPARLLANFKEWCRYAHIEKGFIFPRSQDDHGRPVTGDIIYEIVKTAATRVGLPNIAPHSFRRSMLTYLKGRGVAGSDLQAAVLHSSFSTTERYLKANRAAEQAPGELVLEMLDEE